MAIPKLNNVYVGERYIPKYEGTWDETKDYEGLVIVNYNNSSYVSKRPVPAGTPVTNEEYWALMSNFGGKLTELEEKLSEIEREIDSGEIAGGTWVNAKTLGIVPGVDIGPIINSLPSDVPNIAFPAGEYTVNTACTINVPTMFAPGVNLKLLANVTFNAEISSTRQSFITFLLNGEITLTSKITRVCAEWIGWKPGSTFTFQNVNLPSKMVISLGGFEYTCNLSNRTPINYLFFEGENQNTTTLSIPNYYDDSTYYFQAYNLTLKNSTLKTSVGMKLENVNAIECTFNTYGGYNDISNCLINIPTNKACIQARYADNPVTFRITNTTINGANLADIGTPQASHSFILNGCSLNLTSDMLVVQTNSLIPYSLQISNCKGIVPSFATWWGEYNEVYHSIIVENSNIKGILTGKTDFGCYFSNCYLQYADIGSKATIHAGMYVNCQLDYFNQTDSSYTIGNFVNCKIRNKNPYNITFRNNSGSQSNHTTSFINVYVTYGTLTASDNVSIINSPWGSNMPGSASKNIVAYRMDFTNGVGGDIINTYNNELPDGIVLTAIYSDGTQEMGVRATVFEDTDDYFDITFNGANKYVTFALDAWVPKTSAMKYGGYRITYNKSLPTGTTVGRTGWNSDINTVPITNGPTMLFPTLVNISAAG